MSIVPDTRVGKITFYENHASLWKANFEDLGIESDTAEQLRLATIAARAKYNASIDARDAAKAATQDFYNATTEMATIGAGLLSTIKSYAESTQNPGVYSLAQIPPPAMPAPAPAPGKPTDFSVSLTETGAVMLKWKCANPEGTQGTIYECRRKTGAGGGAFVFIGASGVKSFTDDTLPSGSVGVIYEVTAVRSTKRGMPSLVNVNFGVGGDGMVFASVSENGGMKMAA